MPPADETRGSPMAAIGLVIAVIILGTAATVLAWRSEANTAADRDQAAADVAAATLSELLMQTISSLRSTDGLAIDGSVSKTEFAAAAANLLPGSLFRAIAYAEVVADDDRSEFESRTGFTILDTTGAGEFVAAAQRDPHLVVVAVSPAGGPADALLGFDIASDETRRRAAAASAINDDPQLSDPIRLADSAAAGIFAVQRVRAPDNRVVGYFSSGIPVDALVAAMGNDRTNEVLTLSLGSTIVAGTSSASGRTASFDAGGKTFTVRANDLRETDHGLAWLTGLGTVLLAAVVSLTFRRDRRLTSRLGKALSTSDAVAVGAARLSELTQALASAASAVEVIEVVRRLIPHVLGARHALVIVATETRSGPMLKLDQGLEEFAPEVVDAYRWIAPSDDVPSARAFASDRMILMGNRQRYLEDYPHLADVLQHMGIVAGAHVPVHDPAGVPIAVLSISWAQPVSFNGTIRAVLTTIADAVGQTLTRAALYDHEHELIVELQAALLAPVPEVDGLEIAVRYEPAISVVGIGGDWYDAVLTDSGRLVAVIGDVTGHGAQAVAVMAQVQAVIAHLTRIDTPAPEVLQHAVNVKGFGTSGIF